MIISDYIIKNENNQEVEKETRCSLRLEQRVT